MEWQIKQIGAWVEEETMLAISAAGHEVWLPIREHSQAQPHVSFGNQLKRSLTRHMFLSWYPAHDILAYSQTPHFSVISAQRALN